MLIGQQIVNHKSLANELMRTLMSKINLNVAFDRPSSKRASELKGDVVTA